MALFQHFCYSVECLAAGFFCLLMYPAWYVALLWLRYMKTMHPRSDSKLLERKALGNLGVPWHPILGIKARMPPTVPLRFLHTLHFPPSLAQPGALFLPLLLTPFPSSFSGARQNGDIAATPFPFCLRKPLPVFREPMSKDLPSNASSPF